MIKTNRKIASLTPVWVYTGLGLWKQWKYARVRFAELRKRGVGKDLAAQTAGNAHGPWRLSNSPALSYALPNAYLASLGLPKLVAD